ncbi:MAG: hypothetical protein ACHBNF_07230 [Chromatiales bacterium]
MKPLSLVRENALGFVLCAVVLVGVVAPFVVLDFLYKNLKETELLSFPDFLSASGGVQAVIALFTFLFTAFGASAIFLLRRQVKMDAERVEMDLYRRLISPEMQSTKKLLYAPGVEQILQDLREKLEKPEELGEELFIKVREEIDVVAKKTPTPLVPTGHVSFDHVESLVNEYNFLCKLLQENRIKPKFATDMGVANFHHVYRKVEPLILLRRSIASGKFSKYASHFSQWCE